jgi:hypothetical protein
MLSMAAALAWQHLRVCSVGYVVPQICDDTVANNRKGLLFARAAPLLVQ